MRKHLIRMLLFFTGLWTSAVGVIFILKADNVGLDPWDVFYYGVSKHVHLPIGICIQIVSGICLACTIIYKKKSPKLGTWLVLLLYGRIIDYLVKTPLIPTSSSSYLDFVYLVSGIVAVGVGSGMYISAKWGAGPIDSFTQMISEVAKIKLGKTYVILSILVALIGFILGGSISFCTILYTLTVGPLIQRSYKYCKRMEFLQRTRLTL